MNAFRPGIPQPGEYGPFFAAYIGKAAAAADPVRKLDEQLAEVLSLLRPLDAHRQAHRGAAVSRHSLPGPVGRLPARAISSRAGDDLTMDGTLQVP